MNEHDTGFKELLILFLIQRFHPEARIESDGKKVSLKSFIETLQAQQVGFSDASQEENSGKYEIVIATLLTRVETRQMLFRAWTKLASHLYLSGTDDSERQLEQAFIWAEQAFKTVGIYGPTNFFSRLCVLSEVRSIQFSKTIIDDNVTCNENLEAILKFQSTLEFLITSLADAESFQSKFMKSTFVSFESNVLLFVYYYTPMPNQDTFGRVRKTLLTNIQSENRRLETISGLTSFIQTLIDLLCDKIRVPAKVYEIQALGVKARLEAQISYDSAPEVETKDRREIESTLEMKLMWILDVLVEALEIPFKLPETELVMLVKAIQDITTLDVYSLPEICAQLMDGLKRCCGTNPKLRIPDAVPAYIWNISQMANHPHFDGTQRAIQIVQGWQAYSKQLPIAFEGVFLQVISNPEKIILPGIIASQEAALEETLISSAPGALELDDLGIKWLGLTREANPSFAKLTNALTIRFETIVSFSQGKVKNATNMPYSPRPITNMFKQPINTDITAYCLKIKTLNKVEYRFYPFYDDNGEIFRLEDILCRRTGLSPIPERKFVCHTLAKHLEGVKAELNANYLQKYPPIEHSAELYSLIKKLTQENESASIYAMERLYHSCRQESEVTKECLRNLRMVWYKASSETVWLKVLSIVERILDPAVMSPGDLNFEIIISWMKTIEETVSPYKSAEALKIASILLARAKSMQNNILPTVYRPQKTFDGVELAEKFAGLSFD